MTAIAIDVTGNGPPLVLLHGVGANRFIWRHVSPRLGGERRVLAPDLPGFGESPPAGSGFGLGQVAAVLAEAVIEQTGGAFDLVGNSLGGAVALQLAADRPELVRRLVLAAPAGFSPAPWPVAEMAGRLAGPAIRLRRMVGAPVAGVPVVRRALLWGAIAEPQRLPSDDARTMLLGSRGSSRIGAAVTAVLRADMRPVLARVDAPLGLLWGERDRVVPISTLELIRSSHPHVVVETIPDAAHVPQLERPEEFVSGLLGLLERLG
jgi:pimeloyl-ACP methyl ester carboxylesterase